MPIPASVSTLHPRLRVYGRRKQPGGTGVSPVISQGHRRTVGPRELAGAGPKANACAPWPRQREMHLGPLLSMRTTGYLEALSIAAYGPGDCANSSGRKKLGDLAIAELSVRTYVVWSGDRRVFRGLAAAVDGGSCAAHEEGGHGPCARLGNLCAGG